MLPLLRCLLLSVLAVAIAWGTPVNGPSLASPHDVAQAPTPPRPEGLEGAPLTDLLPTAEPTDSHEREDDEKARDDMAVAMREALAPRQPIAHPRAGIGGRPLGRSHVESIFRPPKREA